MPLSIYILRLEQGKFYVGKTHDLDRRLSDYVQGDRPAWVRKYAPLGIDKIVHNASHFDEDKWVKEYMAQYGIENVRGGAYACEFLSAEQLQTLKRETLAAQDRCHRCGRAGHFVKNCYANTNADGASLRTVTCYRCGKKGHYANTCFVK